MAYQQNRLARFNAGRDNPYFVSVAHTPVRILQTPPLPLSYCLV